VERTAAPQAPAKPDAPQAGRTAPATTAPAPAPAPIEVLEAAGFRMTVSPNSDVRGTRLFVASGRLTPPASLSAAEACGPNGLVSIEVKAGSRTVSTRRVILGDDCTFTSRVTFAQTRRFSRATRLRFTARYLGNTRLSPITAATKLARIR
jgi:hypothetical protein